jgi:hypothetical protein
LSRRLLLRILAAVASPFHYDSTQLPRIPTAEFAQQIAASSGQLYQLALAAVAKQNSDLSQEDIVRGIRKLLGPETVEDCLGYGDLFGVGMEVVIPRFPEFVEVDGTSIPLLNLDFILRLRLQLVIGGSILAWHDYFGGIANFKAMAADHIKRSGGRDDLESHLFQETMKYMVKEVPYLRDTWVAKKTFKRTQTGCLLIFAAFLVGASCMILSSIAVV